MSFSKEWSKTRGGSGEQTIAHSLFPHPPSLTFSLERFYSFFVNHVVASHQTVPNKACSHQCDAHCGAILPLTWNHGGHISSWKSEIQSIVYLSFKEVISPQYIQCDGAIRLFTLHKRHPFCLVLSIKQCYPDLKSMKCNLSSGMIMPWKIHEIDLTFQENSLMGRLSVLCIHHMVVCFRDVRTDIVGVCLPPLTDM